MVTLPQIIDALGTFKASELRVIASEIDKLLAKPTFFDTELFQAVLDSLGVSGSPRMFQSTPNYKTWAKNQGVMDSLIKTIVGKAAPKKVVLYQLKVFLIELLINEIKDRGLQVNMRTVSTHLGYMEDVFDKAFPGYLANGMAGLVLKRIGGEA